MPLKRNRRPIESRFWEKVKISGEDECWLWTSTKTIKGYGKFFIEKYSNHAAHRVAWTLTHGEINDGLCVCHRCDTPLCVNPKHLFLGTTFDNMQDMVRKGRNSDRNGEKNHVAKLNGRKIVEIKLLYETGYGSQQKIANEYGITQANVSFILNGKRWANVDAIKCQQ